MLWLSYLAILGASGGNALKQFAMKNCGQRASGAFNSICINMLRCLICFVVAFVFWSTVGFGGSNAEGNIITVIAGVGNAFSLFAWILASGFIPMSLIEIFNTFGNLVLPLILAPYIFGGDTVTPVQWIGCALLVASVFLFTDIFSKKKPIGAVAPEATRPSIGLPVKIAIVITSAAGTAAASIFQKYYVLRTVESGNGTIEYFNMLSFAVMILLFAIGFSVFVLTRKGVECDSNGKLLLPYRRVWVFILMAAIGLYIYQYSAAVASKLPSAIYFPLLKSAGLIETVILDTVVFKDKLTVKRIISIALVLCAIVLVNL